MDVPILLFDEEAQGCHWQLRQVYTSSFKVLIQEVIQLLLLNQGQGVDLGTEFLRVQYEFNVVVPFLPIQEFIKDSLAKTSLNSW